VYRLDFWLCLRCYSKFFTFMFTFTCHACLAFTHAPSYTQAEDPVPLPPETPSAHPFSFGQHTAPKAVGVGPVSLPARRPPMPGARRVSEGVPLGGVAVVGPASRRPASAVVRSVTTGVWGSLVMRTCPLRRHFVPM
jgi:hypothetical protein